MDVSKSLKPDEVFIKLVKDELVSLLGSDYVPLVTDKSLLVLCLWVYKVLVKQRLVVK